MKLNPMETAPKDKPILVDAGYPDMVMAVWNGVTDQWCYCRLECDLYQGSWCDTYFSNEFEPEKNVFGWLEVPRPEGMHLDKVKEGKIK